MVFYKHLVRHHVVCFRNCHLFGEEIEKIVQRQASRMKGEINISPRESLKSLTGVVQLKKLCI